jgi:hypothetical protein
MVRVGVDDPDLQRAIVLNGIIENLRHQGRTRQLRLSEKLQFMDCWMELKQLVLRPSD